MGDFMILYDINYNIYVINNVEINISFYVRRLKKKRKQVLMYLYFKNW